MHIDSLIKQCNFKGLEPDPARRRDSELSVGGIFMPSWGGRKLSSASMTGGALAGTCGRQTRAGSLSQHEENRLNKHIRVVRILFLNVVAVLVMWLPITVIMILIYIDGKSESNFF